MKTRFESVGKFTVREVVEEYTVFECDKGHKWEETLENRFGDLPFPINFPIPHGENICPFCLGELLANLGRVKRLKRSVVV